MIGEKRYCTAIATTGALCRTWAMHGYQYCFHHSPDHVEEAKEASRQGGLRKRKEAVIADVYDFDGLKTPEDMLRLLDIAVTDTLALENGTRRNQSLINAVSTALRVWEAVVLDQRIRDIQEVVALRRKQVIDAG